MTSYPPEPTPIDDARPPAFHHWNVYPKKWENLGARLLDADPRTKSADLFEIGGVAQYGIDAIGDCATGGGCIVQSAKCYEEATAAKIEDWSDDFLKHWESYWEPRGVRTFILSVAAPNIVSAKNGDQIQREIARFAALGIGYEVWGPEETYGRLRANRDLVNRFLGRVWEEMIFGPSVAPLDAALLQRAALAQGVASDQVDERLITAREAFLEGRFDAVDALLTQLNHPTVWPVLSNATKASALRLSGSLALEREDLDGAETAAQAAAALHPGERRLEAQIAAQRTSAADALAVLGAVSTVRGRVTRAGLLLSNMDVETSHAETVAVLAEVEDPEAVRLLAVIHVLSRRWDEALASAERAFALAPRRLVMRHTLGLVLYVIGLSRSAPAGVAFHGHPPPDELVKTDDLSLQRRERAAGLLSALRVDAPHMTGNDLVLLGCLAHLPGRRDEAVALCAELLAANSLAIEALYWAINDFGELDVAPSVTALTERLNAGEADQAQVNAVVMAWQMKETPQAEIVGRLEAALPGLTGDGASEARRWIALLSGHQDQDARDEEADPDRARHRRALALGEQDDPTRAAASLAEMLAQDPPDPMALRLASRLADRQLWRALAPFAEAIAAFETAYAINLAAHILHFTASPAEVLDLLDSRRGVFPGGILPLVSRRMELTALAETDPAEALKRAQALAAETDDPDDRSFLLQRLLAAGNAQGAITPTRRLHLEGRLSPTDCVRYSVALTGVDPDLSRALWRSAHDRGIPDSFLMPSLSQGFRLGLDAEMKDLIVRMSARAKAGADDVWAVSMDDIIEELERRRDTLDDLGGKLLDGLIPIHLAPRGVFGSIAELYQLETRAQGRSAQRLILLRHGGRAVELQAPKAWAEWQVTLDPTGLVIAEQLDLLDHLEALAQPIRISRSLADVLYGFEQDVLHNQAARVEAARKIVQAQAAGRVEVTQDETESQTVRHGRSRDDGDQPGPTLETVTYALDLASGALAPPEDGEVAETEDDLAQVPDVGGRLMFAHNTLQSLAVDGRLEEALTAFSCAVPRDVLTELACEAEAAADGDKLASRMRGLRERIAAGVLSGRYVYLPAASRSGANADERPDNPVQACLFDALAADPLEGGVVWIDDRHITGYPRTNGNVIVGVIEVLNALEAAGLITAEARRLKLLRLRQGGAVFIPMTAREVLPALRQAPIRNGVLVETEALSILRRNLAAGCRNDQHLKIGDTGNPLLKDRPDEMWFIRTSLKLMEQCLLEVWGEADSTLVQRTARSEWLWAALRLERCIRPLPADQPGPGNAILSTMFAAGLMTTAITVTVGKFSTSKARQQEYMDWLATVLVNARDDPRLAGDYLDRVADHYRTLYGSTFEMKVSAKDLRHVLALRTSQVSMLPPKVRERVLEDGVFAEAVGVRLIETLGFGGETFESGPFWSAIARAARSGRARLTSHAGKSLELTRRADGVHLGAPIDKVLHADFLSIISRPVTERRAAATRFLNDLELSPSQLAGFVGRLPKARTPAGLARLLTEAVEAVAERRYQVIEDGVNAAENLSVQTFTPPSVASLLHSLCLGPAGEPFDARVRAAWTRLSTEQGEAVAFMRLSGLPVSLTELVSSPEVCWALSPVARTHRAAVQVKAGADAVAATQTLLVNEGELALLPVLLEWTRKAFQSDPDWPSLAVEDKLALIWTHAHRVMSYIVAVTDQAEVLIDGFRRVSPDQPIARIVAGDPELSRDVAGPRGQRASNLTYRGLGYVFGGGSPWTQLTSEQQRKIADRLLFAGAEGMGLEPGLFVHDAEAGNVLGSWLLAEPVGLVDPDRTPAMERGRLLDEALDAIKAGEGGATNWLALAAIASSGVDAARRERLKAAFIDLDMAPFANDGAQGLAGAAAILDMAVRLLETPLSVRLGKLNEIARRCSELHSGPVPLDDRNAAGEIKPASAALGRLLDAMIEAIRDPDEAVAMEQLHQGVMAVTSGWPEAAVGIRQIFDHLVRNVDPGRANTLWRTFVQLRGWA